MEPFLLVTIVTLLAGAGGTGLGGVVGALFPSNSDRVVSLLLAFAAGVMTAMVCFDLLAEAVEAANEIIEMGVFIVMAALLFGVLLVYGLNHIIEKRTSFASEKMITGKDSLECTPEQIALAGPDSEFAKLCRQRSLRIAGIVMAAAIAIHNIPEGMTIGAGYAIDDPTIDTGLIMAVLIGLHNIPEGMSIAVPMMSGGMHRVKAIIITALCGLPTLIGAWIGYALGDMGPLGLAISLGFAGGAMLYVVYGEILPESTMLYMGKAHAMVVILGIMLGMVLIFG